MNSENQESDNGLAAGEVDTTTNQDSGPEIVQAELVAEAELVADPAVEQPEVVYSPRVVPPASSLSKGTSGSSLDTPLQLKNINAKGGAVGAVVLGLLAVFGSFVSGWSAINALIGFCMGMWGLSSPKRKLALIGVALCGLGAFLSMVDVSQIWVWMESSGDSEF